MLIGIKMKKICSRSRSQWLFENVRRPGHLKVGSFSFECIIILQIYFINCRKALFSRKYVSFSKKYEVKSIRLAVMLGIP